MTTETRAAFSCGTTSSCATAAAARRRGDRDEVSRADSGRLLAHSGVFDGAASAFGDQDFLSILFDNGIAGECQPADRSSAAFLEGDDRLVAQQSPRLRRGKLVAAEVQQGPLLADHERQGFG